MIAVLHRASDAIWNFTMGMVGRGLKDSATGNSLFSPVSILTTLNMLLLAVTGTTRDEMVKH